MTSIKQNSVKIFQGWMGMRWKEDGWNKMTLLNLQATLRHFTEEELIDVHLIIEAHYSLGASDPDCRRAGLRIILNDEYNARGMNDRA